MEDCKTCAKFRDDEIISGNNNSLQIVHVKLGKIDLWVLISTVGCAEDEIELYDPLQQKPSLDTQIVIARYLRSRWCNTIYAWSGVVISNILKHVLIHLS